MKNNKINIKILYILILIPILFLSSCDPDKNINISPNAISDQSVKSVDGINGLAISMQVGAGEFYTGDRSRILSIWSWQMCCPSGLGRPQPVQWNTYLMVEDGPADDTWKTAYRTVKICNDIISNISPTLAFGTKNNEIQKTISGMAKAYKGMLLGELAALFGDIPIVIKDLEASQFAKQKDAFTEVQKILDDAIVDFGKGDAAGIYSRDLNYKGDKTKWIAACNSLKARYYLMVKDYSKANQFGKLGIQVGGNLSSQYSDNAGEHNPWGHWTLDESGEPIRVDATFMRMLKSEKGDTRIASYFTANGPNGEFVGYVHSRSGIADADSNEKVGIRAASLKKYGSYSAKLPFITADETAFIVSESAARTGDENTATTLVNAVRTAAGLTSFTGTGAILIAEIMKQKHLQLFLEGQSFYDKRRLGTLPDTKIPNRFIYPISEKNSNPNVPSDSKVDMSSVSK